MTDFDFAAYLRRLDPACAYPRVEKLTGGLVNVTARATKDGPAAAASSDPSVPRVPTSSNSSAEAEALDYSYAQGRFPGHRSLILKHGPPYIAGVGASAPMAQGRQDVEAASLALFSAGIQDDGGPGGGGVAESSSPSVSLSLSASTRGVLHHVPAESGVTVPRLLHHDAVEHVLVLSDLGRLPDLSKVFIELGGFTPDAASVAAARQHAPPSSPRLGHALDAHDVARFRRIGEKLGTFFARLHSRRSFESVRAAQQRHQHGIEGEDGHPRQPQDAFPSLPEMKTAVHNHVIKPILTHLLKFPALLDAGEAETLFAAVEADFLRPTPAADEQCVVLGDCWTGAVLVDFLTWNDDVDVDVGVGVIDWEFASVGGRGINGDVSQFLAHLELLRLAAAHTDIHTHTHTQRQRQDARGHLAAVNGIIEGFISTYKANAASQAERRVAGGGGGDGNDNNDRVLRSAYLLHGAEMINCAFWKTWVCRDAACPSCTVTDQGSPPSSGSNVSSSSSNNNGNSGGRVSTTKPQCSVVTSLVRRGVSFLRCAVAEPDPRTGTAKLRENLVDLGLERGTQTMGLYDLFI